MTTMTRTNESTAAPVCLLIAFELSQRTWKLGFTAGAERPRIRQIAARAADRLADEVTRAKARLKLPADAPVVSCYEAGREGFWLHRCLVAQGLTNFVVDSSSIEVNRRARRAKTDRLDLGGLLSLLTRHMQGDRRVWHVVRVPTVSEEDARHMHRTWEMVHHDRNRLINRIKGLLTMQGVQMPVSGNFHAHLNAVRLWDGTALPCGIKERLTRVWIQLEGLNAQLQELEAARAALQTDPRSVGGRCVEQLQTLRGVGSIGAWLLTTEIFAWRQIHNGRELGALVGWCRRRTRAVIRLTTGESPAQAIDTCAA